MEDIHQELRKDPAKWNFWGRWDQPVLSAALWHRALYSEAFQALTPGIRGNLEVLRGDFYFFQPDVDIINSMIERGGRQWYRDLFIWCDRLTEAIRNFKGSPKEFILQVAESRGTTLVEFADRFFERQLRSACEKRGLDFGDVFALLQPEKKTTLMEYQEELQEVTESSMDAFVEKWKWIGTHAFEGEPLTRERLMSKQGVVRSSVEDMVQPATISLDEEMQKIIEIGKELVFQRSNSIEVCDKAIFEQRGALTNLAELHGLTYEDLISCTDGEVLALIDTNVVPEGVSVRAREYGYIGIGDAVTIVVGEELKREMRIHQSEKIKDVAELKGTTAYKGVVRGTVRLVRSPADTAKVRDGDILVATETLPDYIMAMNRAAAFVTTKEASPPTRPSSLER